MLLIKLFKWTMTFIFISFFCTVILSLSGYYQTFLQKQTILTNDAINAFEQDIKDGKDIDINNYIENNQKNYDNAISKTGRFISNKLNNLISGTIEKTLKIIIKAIEE